MVFAARSEGGVRHDSDKKCGKAAFLYLSHSAVVIPCESALTLQTREKGEKDESDPPQTSGGACDLDSALAAYLYPGPMGSLSSSFIPAGRLRNSPAGAALKARRRTYEMARDRP